MRRRGSGGGGVNHTAFGLHVIGALPEVRPVIVIKPCPCSKSKHVCVSAMNKTPPSSHHFSSVPSRLPPDGSRTSHQNLNLPLVSADCAKIPVTLGPGSTYAISFLLSLRNAHVLKCCRTLGRRALAGLGRRTRRALRARARLTRTTWPRWRATSSPHAAGAGPRRIRRPLSQT